MMAFQLYNCDDGHGHDYLKVQHGGNISMTVASVFMIVITVSEIQLGLQLLYNYTYTYIIYYVTMGIVWYG